MKIKRQTVVIWGLILLGLAFLAIGVLLQDKPKTYYAHSLRNYQEADAVAGYPIKGEGEGQFWTAEFQPELNLLSGIERYRIPMARGFEKPNGSPVKAAGNGLVLAIGEVVVLGHRLPDGKIVQTLYRKLNKVNVRVGQLIPRGAKLGEAEAEFHFEIYESDGIDLLAENRLDVTTFLEKHPLTETFPEPLAVMRANDRQLGNALQKLKLDAKSAEKLGEILGGKK